MVTNNHRRPAIIGRVGRPIVAVVLLTLAGCDQLATTPFPEFLGYTDVSVDLEDEIDRISSAGASIEYALEVVYTPTDDPRVLLLVEPPIAEGGNDFNYRGRLIFFDQDLNLIGTVSPLTGLDTFGPPFTYDHDGTIIVANSIFDADATVAEDSVGVELTEGLTFLGIEGPGFADQSVGDTIVFSLDAGEFAAFDLVWYRFFDAAGRPWSFDGPFVLPIIPVDARSGSAGDDDLGYQILALAYNDASDEVTFVLSEPSVPRVVAARAALDDIRSGAVTALADGPDGFPIEVDADRPLDAHADSEGFFLRRRDGWLDRYAWSQTGALERVGSERVVGDRAFDRTYGFLSGPDAPEEYMYRFDPGSRILTRYARWW